MASAAGLDFERMESALAALASANRLRLLAMLAEPTTLDKIHLRPGAAQAGGSPARPISRQAVLRHLRLLSKAGIVETRKTVGAERPPANEYVADRARLYGLLEDLREVAQLGSPTPFEAAATVLDDAARRHAWPAGPKLALARGAYEGKAFPLALHGRRTQARWQVGRRPGSPVCLDYDPYVSMDHCEIRLDAGEYRLHDLPAAKNGTWLNWQPIQRGGDAALQAGDVIGAGRSLLVFRDA
jgi:DNA-binding transcriptional ArsR family regulator